MTRRWSPPDGRPGVYYYENGWEGLSVGNSFAHATRIHTVIAASMPLLEDNLALYFQGYDILNYQDELTLFKDSRIPLLFDSDILSGTDFLALNRGEGYGRLRVLASDERPHPRDIALYEALPNELPRVAGIISHRTPDAAFARQPAGRPGRHSQRLHPRRPRRPCHRAPDRSLRSLHGVRGGLGSTRGHQGGSR